MGGTALLRPAQREKDPSWTDTGLHPPPRGWNITNLDSKWKMHPWQARKSSLRPCGFSWGLGLGREAPVLHHKDCPPLLPSEAGGGTLVLVDIYLWIFICQLKAYLNPS